MIHDHAARRALRRLVMAAGLSLPLAACIADDHDTRSGQALAATSTPQPRRATYDCGTDGRITVENMRTAVRLVEEGDGDSYDLPAAPPTQTSRFGADGMALVVEDREALWMKAGSEPMTCRR